VRRLLETAATALLCLAGLPGGEALAIPASVFGTLEVRAESHEELPQWGRVLREVAREEAAYAACAAGGGGTACAAAPALRDWTRLLGRLALEPRLEQLRAVNLFVNRWPYRPDHDTYGRRDHWATPLEFFVNSGDCEDYAIAKYVSLRRLGVPADDLRMVVLQDTSRGIAHAVLVARAGVGSDWLVLDNLSETIQRQRDLPHYVPYYSVNETTRWAHVPPDDAAVLAGGPADDAAAAPSDAAGRD
jgi:predicted transglutaminase-like cysteine proteinase